MATPSSKRIPPPPAAKAGTDVAAAAAEAQRRIDELAQEGVDADEVPEGYAVGANGSPIRPARKQIDDLGFKGAKADSSGTLPRFDLRIS